MNCYSQEFVARTRLELQLAAANRRVLVAHYWCGVMTAALVIGSAAYIGWCL